MVTVQVAEQHHIQRAGGQAEVELAVEVLAEGVRLAGVVVAGIDQGREEQGRRVFLGQRDDASVALADIDTVDLQGAAGGHCGMVLNQLGIC